MVGCSSSHHSQLLAFDTSHKRGQLLSCDPSRVSEYKLSNLESNGGHREPAKGADDENGMSDWKPIGSFL